MATTPVLPTARTATGVKKSVLLNVAKGDVASIAVVDTDFVLTLKSGRKVLIRDGALRSATEEEFGIEFLNNEVVSGKTLFSEAQAMSSGSTEINWGDGAVIEGAANSAAPVASAALVVPATGITFSYLTLGGAAAALAVAAGSKKSDAGNTQTEQQTAAQAMAVITTFAQANTASLPTPPSGTAPTASTYANAKVSGVNTNNIQAINDALATAYVTADRVSTPEKLQELINAYNAIYQLADGKSNATANATLATPVIALEAYQRLGVDVSAMQTDGNTSISRLALLNSLVDKQNTDGINTIFKINQLIQTVDKIQTWSSGQLASTTLTASDFEKIGVLGVTSNNLTDFLSSIVAATPTGADTLGELQSLLYGALKLENVKISPDSGVSDSDFITKATQIMVSGTSNAQDGTALKVVLKAANDALTTLNAVVRNGKWDTTSNTLQSGVYEVSLQILNGDNQVIRTQAGHTITIDNSSRLPDGSPDPSLSGTITITGTATSEDDNTFNSTFKTTAKNLWVVGTSTAANGTHVAVTLQAAGSSTSTTLYGVVTNNTWRVDNTQQALSLGAYTVKAALIDLAGNEAVADTHELLIRPSNLQILNKTLGDIGAEANLVLEFNVDVTGQAGRYIRIVDESTRNEIEAIDVTDTRYVIYSGTKVIINPVSKLVVGNSYVARIDALAFAVKAAQPEFEQTIIGSNDWRFRAVDPSMTITLADANVSESNGINAAEFNQFVIQGTITTINRDAVQDLKLTQLRLVGSNNTVVFAINENDLNIPISRANNGNLNWTLSQQQLPQSWRDLLAKGGVYQFAATLQSSIQGTAQTSTAVGNALLFDVQAPTLDKVEINKAVLKAGELAIYTLTFSEDPGDSLSADDFTIGRDAQGNSVGSIQSIATPADGRTNVRFVTFVPTANTTILNTTALVLSGNFSDKVGNTGTINSGVTWPTLNIDTAGVSFNFNAIGDDTGFSATDFITKNNAVVFKGDSSALNGSVVKIIITNRDNTTSSYNVTVQNGIWQSSAITLQRGVYSIEAQLLNNNDQPISRISKSLTVDDSAIELPDGSSDTDIAGKTISIDAVTPDTGQADFITSSPKVTLTGKSNATVGSHVAVHIRLGSTDTLYYTTVDANGNWSLPDITLTAATYQIKAALTDAAGNEANFAQRDLTITPDSLPATILTADALASTANLMLSFAQDVSAANGSIVIVDRRTGQIHEEISTTSNQVTLSQDTNNKTIVTINPSRDLVAGNSYYVTVSSGAFKSTTTGLAFAGITDDSWKLLAADPSTSLQFAGTGVNVSNGVNASELSQLTLQGTIQSADIRAVSNLRLVNMRFTNNDDANASFDLPADLLPNIVNNANTWSWTLHNASGWTQRLASGNHYTVSVTLQSDIKGVTQLMSTTVSDSVLIDVQAPKLESVEIDKAVLKAGELAIYTLTFSEDPGDSLSADDFTIGRDAQGNPVGSIQSIATPADGRTNVRFVTFVPTANTTILNTTALVLSGSFSDKVGNTGTIQSGVTWPTLNIDTAGVSFNFNAIGDDTGFSATDFITKNNAVVFKGDSSALNGSVVKIIITNRDNTTSSYNVTVQNGIWQSSAITLQRGVYSIEAQLLNNNDQPISRISKSLTVDDSAIELPDGSSDTDIAGKTISIDAITPDTGQADFITSSPKVTLTGTSNATVSSHVAVHIRLGSTDTLYYTTVDANGNWSLPDITLTAATYQIKAALTDAAGNEANFAQRDLTITDASVLLQDFTEGSVASTANLRLAFNQDVTVGTSGFINIIDKSTGQIYDSIDVRSNRVSISGNTVTVNPKDLISGVNYYATISNGAFKALTGTEFGGVNDKSWSFQAVDPTTTVAVGGNGVVASNGINAAEFGNLTIGGLVSSPDKTVINNLRIGKITFVDMDDASQSFDLATRDLPTINAATGSWQLASPNTWANKPVSGRRYNIVAVVQSEIGTTALTSSATYTQLSFDTVSPALVITSNKTSAGFGEAITFTFTFNEAPVGFDLSDIVVAQLNNVAVGTLSDFKVSASDPLQYTVVLTPTPGITATNGISLISVAQTSYSDSFGNNGSANANAPVVILDTKLPPAPSLVTNGFYSFANSNNAVRLAIVRSMTAPAATEAIRSIKLKVTGADATSDRLFLTSNLGTNFDSTPINHSLLNNTVTVNQAPNNEFVFTKVNGSNFTPTEINTLLIGLSFLTSLTSKQGDRNFEFSYTNASNNSSAVTTSKLTVDTIVPLPIDLRSDIPNSIETTNKVFYNLADNGKAKAMAPLVGLTTDKDITQVQVRFSNINLADRVVLGTLNQVLDNTPVTNGRFQYDGIDFGYTYDTSSLFNKAITIFKVNGNTFSAIELLALEQALGFQAFETTSARNAFIKLFHLDGAGNSNQSSEITMLVDTVVPVFDLDTASSTSINRTVTAISTPANATALQNPSGVALVTDNGRIGSVKVVVKNVRNGSSERLLVGNADLDASGNVLTGPTASPSGSVLVNTTEWNWTYNRSGEFTFSRPFGETASASETQALVQSMSYRNTLGATASDEARQFLITVTDETGNASQTATSTLAINLRAPTAATANALIAIDGNNDGVVGDQFIVRFSEPVLVANPSTNVSLTDTSRWALSAGTWGTTTTITPIDSVIVDGRMFASNLWFKPGADANLPIDSGATISLTLAANLVTDINNTPAASNLNFSLSRTSGATFAGTRVDNTINGDTSNDFIASGGSTTGVDRLRGGSGADTFAFLQGDRGIVTISDFRASEGDMLNVSGMLQNVPQPLSLNSTDAELGKYIQKRAGFNDLIIEIDPTGRSFFATSNASYLNISMSNRNTSGADDTIRSLIAKKILIIGPETATPLVLDLNGDGVHTTSVQEGVRFDMMGYGLPVQTGWTDGQDGLLVLDLNHDGVINSGLELFGNGTRLASGNKAADGFAALQMHDNNQDGVINAYDDVFTHLQVWVDRNHDGVSQASELHALKDVGVQSMALNAQASTTMDNGNALSLVSHWTSQDGTRHALVDVNFTTKETPWTATATHAVL